MPTAGGKILLLDGTYTQSTDGNGINLAARDKITISGMGAGTKLAWGAAITSGSLINSTSGSTNCVIENLYLDGTAVTALAGSVQLISLYGNDHLIQNCTFIAPTAKANATYSVMISGDAGGTEGFRNRVVNNTILAGYFGISTSDGAMDVLIQGNTIYDCTEIGIMLDGGGIVATHATVTGNSINNCGIGIFAQSEMGDIIANNSVRNTQTAAAPFYTVGDGIHLNVCVGVVVDSNYIYSAYTNGIELLGGCDGVSVRNNVIQGVSSGVTQTDDGISLTAASRSNVTGNSITMQVAQEPKYGIYVFIDASSTDNVIINNNILSGSTAKLLIDVPAQASGVFEPDEYSQVMTDEFASVLEADTNYILESTSVAAGSGSIAAASLTHQPDVPRNVTLTITQVGGTITAYTIEVQGYDAKGRRVQENFTFPGGGSPWTQTGNVAFSKIIYVYWSVTGAGAGDTMILGIGQKLGLTGNLNATGDVLYVKQSGATTAAYTANASYDTIAPTAIVEPDDVVVYYRNCLNNLNKVYTDTVST